MEMSRKGLNTLYGEGTLIQSGPSKKSSIHYSWRSSRHIPWISKQMQRQEYTVIAYLGIVIRKIGHNKYYYLDKIQTIAFDTLFSITQTVHFKVYIVFLVYNFKNCMYFVYCFIK